MGINAGVIAPFKEGPSLHLKLLIVMTLKFLKDHPGKDGLVSVALGARLVLHKLFPWRCTSRDGHVQ